MRNELHFCRFGFLPFDHDAFTEERESLVGRNAFDLHQICARVFVPRFGEQVFQRVVIREQENSLAVDVQPSNGIDIARERSEIP